MVSTKNIQKEILKIVNHVRMTGELFATGRRNKPEVFLIKFPDVCNEKCDEITNINAISRSFDFLADEPDLYTLDDAKEVYV